MQVEKLPLDEIRAQVENCHACSLCETRTNIVFGDGDPHARVLIVGEAPGKNEDLQGKPFVGAAGKFLDELLEEAGLKREEVFIANVLKCRPLRIVILKQMRLKPAHPFCESRPNRSIPGLL